MKTNRIILLSCLCISGVALQAKLPETKLKSPPAITKKPHAGAQAEVAFSAQPFEGNATAKIIKTFNAFDEIYGRVKFSQPIKSFLSNPEENFYRDNGSIEINFEIKTGDGSKTHTGVSKNLSKEELEKNYFDFDIAPALNRSNDVYFVDFSGGIAGTDVPYFQKRSSGSFIVSSFIMTSKGEKLEEVKMTGEFTIDYSKLPAGDAGVTKLSEWERMIALAARSEQVEENKKRKTYKASGASSSITFMNAKKENVSAFSAGDEIYGKIMLPKPLKEYANGTVKQLRIDFKSINDNIQGSVSKMIRASELENSFIEFDIAPALTTAKDVYDSNLGFSFFFYGNSNDPQKNVKFDISLSSDYNTNYNNWKKFDANGELSVDYSKLNKTQVAELFTKGQTVAKEAEKNASKAASIENGIAAKNLPLPVVFTKASKTGYTGYSNVVITNMIKARFKIKEVYMLTFDVAEGSGDFRSLTDLNNYPSEKLGNHVFYFAFKDELDGQYKFSGGRLRMLYEGNGKYSEAFIFPYSPIMGDEKFPFDQNRKDLGFESVFFMDGARIKK
jgi:hypothetical protein